MMVNKSLIIIVALVILLLFFTSVLLCEAPEISGTQDLMLDLNSLDLPITGVEQTLTTEQERMFGQVSGKDKFLEEKDKTASLGLYGKRNGKFRSPAYVAFNLDIAFMVSDNIIANG